MEPLQMYRTPPPFLQRKRKFCTLTVFNAANSMVPHDYNNNNQQQFLQPYHSWMCKKLKIDNVPSLVTCQQHHHHQQSDNEMTDNEPDNNMELSCLPGDLKKTSHLKQMNDLPPEMVVEILRYLPTKDLLNCCHVNRKLNEFASYLLSPSGSTYRRDCNLLESEFSAYCNLT